MSAAIVLALASGASLAVQYAIMLAVTTRGVSLASALLVNSLVGLVVLGAIETSRDGPRFIIEIVARAKPWFVLPGLLGTFFVFASLYGYQHQGAAATIVLVVAAQLATGLVLDGLGLTGTARPIGGETLLGAALLVTGAVLVVR
jgi:bacterial/archaeal transporter family-2 protein